MFEWRRLIGLHLFQLCTRPLTHDLAQELRMLRFPSFLLGLGQVLLLVPDTRVERFHMLERFRIIGLHLFQPCTSFMN